MAIEPPPMKVEPLSVTVDPPPPTPPPPPPKAFSNPASQPPPPFAVAPDVAKPFPGPSADRVYIGLPFVPSLPRPPRPGIIFIRPPSAPSRPFLEMSPKIDWPAFFQSPALYCPVAILLIVSLKLLRECVKSSPNIASRFVAFSAQTERKSLICVPNCCPCLRKSSCLLPTSSFPCARSTVLAAVSGFDVADHSACGFF